MRAGLSHSEAGKLGAIAALTSISHLKQERIEKYLKNPSLCKYCNNIIPYESHYENLFCNSSCAAYYNNQNRKVKKYCLYCNKEINYNNKYCNWNCLKALNWEKLKQSLIKDGYDLSYQQHNAKKYLIELNAGACQICKLSKWNGQQMPLVLDHINGNSNDNNLCNLRVICNNCDALTDFYKAKNKGNGRLKRRKRYKKII